jgi:hypothetical protein
MFFFNHAIASILCTFPIVLFVVFDPFQLFIHLFKVIEDNLFFVLDIPTVEAMMKFGKLPENFVVAYSLFILPIPLIVLMCVLLWPSSRVSIPKLEKTTADSEATRCFAMIVLSLGLFFVTVYFLTGTPIATQFLSQKVLTLEMVFCALLTTAFVVNMALQFYLFSYPFYLRSKNSRE